MARHAAAHRRHSDVGAVSLMPSKHVHFDEHEDVLASLELVGEIVPLLKKRPAFWKWAIIGSHSALQGAFVCYVQVHLESRYWMREVRASGTHGTSGWKVFRLLSDWPISIH